MAPEITEEFEKKLIFGKAIFKRQVGMVNK